MVPLWACCGVWSIWEPGSQAVQSLLLSSLWQEWGRQNVCHQCLWSLELEKQRCILWAGSPKENGDILSSEDGLHNAHPPACNVAWIFFAASESKICPHTDGKPKYKDNTNPKINEHLSKAKTLRANFPTLKSENYHAWEKVSWTNRIFKIYM